MSTASSNSFSYTLSISNSTISNNGGSGLDAFRVVSATITGNTFSGNEDIALKCSSPAEAAITDNVFTANYDVASIGLGGGRADFTGNSGSGNVGNGFGVYGSLGEPISFPSLTGLVYRLRNSLTINAAATIAAGAVFKADSSKLLAFNGTVAAHGTVESPVVFTSVKDDTYGGDTNGDGDASEPAPGDWNRIEIGEGVHATLEHVVLHYGGYVYCNGGCTYHPMVESFGSLTIKHGDLRYSKHRGILMQGSGLSLVLHDTNISANADDGVSTASSNSFSYRLSISNSTISNNGGSGLRLYRIASAMIRDSRLSGNQGAYGLYATALSGATVDARYNWWGHDSGPAPYGSGNGINYTTSCSGGVCTIIPYVDVIPWIGQETYYGQNVPNVVYEADPVNTANGNYAYQHTDLSIPTRGLPLAFTRAYNSLSGDAGPLGYGWRHNWGVTVVEYENDVRITYGDGRQIRFIRDGDDYVPTVGVFSTLEESSGVFHLTEKDQTVYHFGTGGRLDSVEDRNGNASTLAYDPQGRLSTVTGPAGRSLTFAYTSPISATLVSQVTDPAGRTLGFTYNVSGELAMVTDVRGYTTTYTYDAGHRLLTITDANGHTFVTNEYNDAGRVSTQWDGQGSIWTFAYDEPNHRTIVTDPLGRGTTYQYDALLRLTSETDAIGEIASYGYDDDNNRIQLTDKRGNVTRYAYDDRGNAAVITDALTFTRTFAYDAQNDLTREMNPLGYTTVYTYDLNSNLIAREDALGNVARWGYDAHGQLIHQTDALGRVTRYGYDTYGHQVAITDSLVHPAAFTYDLVGRRVSETDAKGRTITYTYDAANHLLAMGEPLGRVTAYTYDQAGNRNSITNPRGGVTWFTYDNKDQLAGVTDPLSQTTHFGYDAVGNQVVVTDALGHATTYGYDPLNRRMTITDALGNAVTYGYDAGGNRTSLTDANSNVTEYAYDPLKRLVAVTDAEGGTVAYAYDAVGNRTVMTDANSHVTTYTYDPLSRLTGATDPLNSTAVYTYDGVGNRIAQQKPDGIIITYAYDASDRLDTISAPGLEILYGYDEVGNREAMTDTTGVTTYIYDDLDRLTQVAAPTGTLQYAYDLNGNRTHLVYPDGEVVTYTYDLSDRLTNVTDWESRVITYTYDGAGRQTEVANPNSTWAVYAYDEADRLLGITHTSAVSGVIAVFTYTLDAVGNRLAMHDLEGTTSYDYDDLYRLTEVTYPDGEQVTYAYDPMGNRTAMTSTVNGVVTYTYDASDRLLSAGPITFAWDANGRQTGKGAATYSYDALDRLTQVVSGTTTVQFTYNGDGARVGKTVDGLVTEYVQEIGAPFPIVVVETTGGQTRFYMYGTALVTTVGPAGDRSSYHADGLGTVRALTNHTGQLTDGYAHDAFGQVRSHTGGVGQPFSFAGEQRDAELGLVFLRSRYLDPGTGRFITPDPWRGQENFPQTLNRYPYVANDPVNHVDPSGAILDEVSDAIDRGLVKLGQKGENIAHNLTHLAEYVRDMKLALSDPIARGFVLDEISENAKIAGYGTAAVGCAVTFAPACAAGAYVVFGAKVTDIANLGDTARGVLAGEVPISVATERAYKRAVGLLAGEIFGQVGSKPIEYTLKEIWTIFGGSALFARPLSNQTQRWLQILGDFAYVVPHSYAGAGGGGGGAWGGPPSSGK